MSRLPTSIVESAVVVVSMPFGLVKRVHIRPANASFARCASDLRNCLPPIWNAALIQAGGV